MKKKDSEVISTSSGTSRGSEHHKGSFSLRRIFHGRRNRSKSRISLDSDSGRSETSLNSGSQGDTLAMQPISPFQGDPVKGASGGEGSSSRESMRECPVCLTEYAASLFPDITTCHHRTCRECLRQYLQIEITESRVNIACPECAERFHPNDIETILQDRLLMGKYEDFMLRRVLAMDPDTRWCPAPDCGFAVIAQGCAGCPKLKCERPGCETYFCYHCKQYWHPNQTCDAARAERSPNLRSASITYNQDTSTQSDIKPCPRCGAFIVKMNDGSCNHMTCAVCGAEFCWLCMKEISDLHYLSPSGCTFWGKKPWSRKKKILWQLGTLVGAPVGITLVAGIAMPAMIIGIPIWVGRKIHSRYEGASRHKRNLAITGGVTASILVSPIIAGLAVGIGVPILLAYVYGVVPISLCRSGGCGVTTTDTGALRFEFDEENDATSHGGYNPNNGDTHSVETSQHVANPSLAPSIGEASMGLTGSLSASGSHMERVGVLRDESDRDSASHRAMAGSSLNGSLCGSSYYSHYHNRLEVQADVSAVSSGKRASFSSDSANLSLGDRASTAPNTGDDASTRALAGSILSARDKDGISLSSPPLESDEGCCRGPYCQLCRREGGHFSGCDSVSQGGDSVSHTGVPPHSPRQPSSHSADSRSLGGASVQSGETRSQGEGATGLSRFAIPASPTIRRSASSVSMETKSRASAGAVATATTGSGAKCKKCRFIIGEEVAVERHPELSDGWERREQGSIERSMGEGGGGAEGGAGGGPSKPHLASHESLRGSHFHHSSSTGGAACQSAHKRRLTEVETDRPISSAPLRKSSPQPYDSCMGVERGCELSLSGEAAAASTTATLPRQKQKMSFFSSKAAAWDSFVFRGRGEGSTSKARTGRGATTASTDSDPGPRHSQEREPDCRSLDFPLSDLAEKSDDVFLSSGKEYLGKEYTGREYLGKEYTGREYLGKDYSGKEYTGKDYSGKDYSGREYTGREYTGKEYGLAQGGDGSVHYRSRYLSGPDVNRNSSIGSRTGSCSTPRGQLKVDQIGVTLTSGSDLDPESSAAALGDNGSVRPRVDSDHHSRAEHDGAGHVVQRRRYSCELALRNGRIAL